MVDVGGMRVAQVIGRFAGGGAQRLAYNLACGLRNMGICSTAIAIRQAGGFGSLRSDGPEIIGLEGSSKSWCSSLRAAIRLRKVVKDRGIELLHVHGSHTVVFCALALLGMRERPRMAFTWHNSESVLTERGMRRRLLIWAIKGCDYIFGPCRSVVQRLTEEVPALAAKTRVFVNGVPVIPSRIEGDGGEPVLLWMARFVPSKDPLILIRVASRLRNEGLQFRVVMAGSAHRGSERFMEECGRLISDLKLESVISMPGWVENTEELIRSASIGVQTSHAEGLSMTLLEQMMAGLAVVATDVGDTAVAIENGKTGILIAPKDEHALADALRCLILDQVFRRRLGAAARAHALSAFSLRRMAQQVLDYCGSNEEWNAGQYQPCN